MNRENMKVLFMASDNFRGSGAFISMTVLNTLLRDKYGVQTKIIIPARDIGDGIDLLKENNIQYKKIRSFNWCQEVGKKRNFAYWIKTCIKYFVNRTAVFRICRYIKKEKIDIVHINTSYSYVGAIAAKKMHVKLVWHLREFLEEDQKMEIQNKKKGYELINRADRIIAISESIRNKYRNVFDAERIVVVYNGIAVKKFYDAGRSLFSTQPVIGLCVGRVTEKKNQFEVVKALAGLEHVELELWLVGNADADEKEKIEEYVKQHNLQSKVKFLGPKNNVEDYYKKSDLYFMTSSAEAFGRVTVEAMLAGCLVIGADCGATKELIEHGVTGFLYENDNVNELSSVVANAMENKEKMKQIAQKGQDTAKSCFSAERNAENVYKLYCEVLNQSEDDNE
ncbi:MAG: glycosyltransferase family 4 protein [Lachnospiraceae bacterium]|nr:glycosyltransferase family 4 protein [Lachnospiraceae bacterium]